MSGKRVFNWREGDRIEYLAEFLLSGIGLVTPVPRQEEVGVDFYCALADQEKGAITFGYPFLVQVRSMVKPVVHLKPPKRYRHQKGVLPDHLSWLFRQELPMFLALVDKEEISIRLYSLSPIWFLYHDQENCPACSSLRLVPRTDGNDPGPVGPPRRLGKVTSSPESYEYEVDLGFPIASYTAKDTANRQTLSGQKSSLELCIETDLQSIMFSRADLPHFYWMAETNCEKEGPIPALYSKEAPRNVESSNKVYSFLGPLLIPLALRYKADNRSELLEALRDLFREMPANTIPPDLQRALPEIFKR
jgi:hypothetical protein